MYGADNHGLPSAIAPIVLASDEIAPDRDEMGLAPADGGQGTPFTRDFVTSRSNPFK
jgi:hypothetical protein